MLQRAASNAYSWWWASHIRTTQSKWLDANLQDVENRVKIMLKLLGEEADSFGKRAEMYYRRRPEVINHVEDVYRAYRALVERYDHLSKELHKANHTIATACPEEVQYAMLEEEDDNFPRAIMPINSRKIQKSTVDDILKRKREGTPGRNRVVHERPDPNMSKEKAEAEIGRLQKAILVMQTEKEFVKSSYESGIAKYWEIEKQIADMQEEICHMQDEFDAHAAIDDDEARALMTITALRSCQGTVAKLVEKFEELIRSAKMESEKIVSLRERFYALSRIIDPSKEEVDSANMTANDRVYPITQEILELQTIYDKIEDFFENNSESSVEEMAYKVDELVDKIINLELKFPKQSAQIKQLKEENEKINNKLDDLQDEMALRDDPSDSSEELKLVEDELNKTRALEGSIIEEEVLVSTAFSEVFTCITNISKAFVPIGAEDLPELSAVSAAAGDKATLSEDVSMGNGTTENSKTDGGEISDIEAPPTGDNLGRHSPQNQDDSEVVDHNSSGSTDGVHDSKNGDEESVQTGNCSMQEEFRDNESLQAGNHVDLVVGPDNENSLNKLATDSSSKEVDQSSSGGMNVAQGQTVEGEYSPTAASQNHLLPSESLNALHNKNESNEDGLSVEVAESSFGGDNRTQDLKIDGVENPVPGNSLTQEEGFGVGDGESPKAITEIGLAGSANSGSFGEEGTARKNSSSEGANSSSDAGKNLDLCHADEAKSSGEELPKQGGQLVSPVTILGLDKHGEVGSSDEGVQKNSLGHVNAYSSEVRDETSLSVPARDSEETGGAYPVISEVPTDSEDMVNHTSDGQLENKEPNVKMLASKENILNNHGSSSGHEKSTSISQEDAQSGLEGRDAILLADYTAVLRNYKETKRRLAELEKKNQEHLEDTKAVIRELRNANSMKYVEIQSLKGLLDSSEMPPSTTSADRSDQTLVRELSIVKETDSSYTDAPESASAVEMKFRTEIDELVDENLRFLTRYSMACHQVQDFNSRYQELLKETESSENKKRGGEPDATMAEPEPAEKKLRELRTEVDVWFEQNVLLDRDLQLKTASLCSLQEEIAEALRSSTETDGAKFTPYEAAKFQGEVRNMQQSNKKIESELQAALEGMRELEGEVNVTLRKLRESFELSSSRRSSSRRGEADSGYQNQFKHFPSRHRVPLRNFLFGTKPKKKSLFACINPTYQRQFSDF
ncbi:protein NETWORKED 2D [Triticum aestivum]|uniref:protein NETWORKED 2D n=1 Tax=Triticum aestivum TaxID=4565 RepID=UPI001D0052D7|nr:protein NETWORKED 2D-like [Triticum aestivum]